VLSDNGREFCGRPDQQAYELFLQLEEIEHHTIRVKRTQSTGIVERLHRTLLDEHFRVEGRTWFETIEEMQAVLDDYLVYDQRRPHRDRGMNGRMPETFGNFCLATGEGGVPETQSDAREARISGRFSRLRGSPARRSTAWLATQW